MASFLKPLQTRRIQLPRLVKLARFLVGAAILYVVVAGSLNDFMDFITGNAGSAPGLLLAMAVAAGVIAFFYLTRPELRPNARVGIPSAEALSVYEEPQLRIYPIADMERLWAMSKLAQNAFTDPMPFEKIRELHWHSRDSVFMMESPALGIVGYSAFFFPKPDLVEEIYDGVTDPLDWSRDRFLTGEERWKSPFIYLESTVIVDACRNRFTMLMHHVIAHLEENLASRLGDTGRVTVLALGATPEGRNLLDRTLGFEKISDASVRKDEMALYARDFTLADIRELRKRINAHLNLLLERKASHLHL